MKTSLTFGTNELEVELEYIIRNKAINLQFHGGEENTKSSF